MTQIEEREFVGAAGEAARWLDRYPRHRYHARRPEAAASAFFDSFFTAKEPGKGTGQGLANSCTTITKKHGGTLTFNSEVGEVTVFVIRLPLVGRDQPEVAA